MSRGFSLVELLVGLAIGAAGVAIAAYFAGAAIRSRGRSDQVNNLRSGTRVVGKQIRSDLRVAGYGSTGAIGVPATFAANIPSLGGWPALPVVMVADNLGAGALSGGGDSNMPGSDALSIVVPDPSTIDFPLMTLPIALNAPVLGPGVGCDATQWIYVADYSAGNGAGRSQLVAAGDPSLFNVSAGSAVLCARLSVYWVDTNRILRRTDIPPSAPVGFAAGTQGQVPFPTGGGGAAVVEAVAPGVLDFQVAAGFSSEAAGRAIANEDGRWAYSAAGSLAPSGIDWFEVRQVRVSLYVRTLRAVEEPGSTGGVEAAIENSAVVYVPRDFDRAYAVQQVVTSETLNNLRFFDMNLPMAVAANPF